ncbi:MAG: PGAP1-like protein [Deltaproteobacteria bacterium ADurb.Bin022]|nr:MAG: PGAP1-like protein [Deltaproteobacteria bacterium ADurb.Bin022]
MKIIPKTARILLVIMMVTALSGCALFKLREDVKISKDSCLLFGEVQSPSKRQKPIIVVAYSRSGETVQIADYAVLSEPGQYELLVQDGIYEIFAFEDLNGSLSYDPNEPGGFYGRPDPVKPQMGGVIVGLDIMLDTSGRKPASTFAGSLAAFSGGKSKPPTSAGFVSNLDNPAFSAENGAAGFWAPLEYFRRTGCNIFFLEPYDPKKTPVLFVHGAAGSPQDWRCFIQNLDRSRYQPWVFYYPSGARLDTVYFLLQTKLYELHRKYAFENLYVVAHSMGGLVSRAAIMEDSTFSDSIRLFVSISSPWGGEGRAKTGVEKSPAVIPSWKDVEPDSPYIQRIFSKKLDPSIRYYLFFGHKGGGSLFRQNNDNTVTLESMLDPRAQADALKVTGLNEDHVSILCSPEMLRHFQAVLAATEDHKDKTYVRSRGYLQVEHAFDPPGTKIPSQMSLVLAPSGTRQKEKQLKINPFQFRQETGAIVPGRYDVSLCALGFRTEPDHQALEIKAGQITDAKFTLKPQGMIANLIYAKTAMDDRFWGFYKELPDKVKIRAIRLSGPGVSRSLTPDDKMNDREVLATFLASRDYAYKNSFAFFDLPAGTYDLTIEADGCDPWSEKVKAQPGEFTPPAPIRLIVK